LIYLNQKIP